MRIRLLIGLVATAALVAVTLLAAGPRMTRIVSPHFLLVGDASVRDIRQVALRLEQFRETLSRVLGRASIGSSRPTVVFVFDSERSFRPFKPVYQGKPREVAGYFQGGPDANYIALTIDGGEASYPIIFHEYTHLMLHDVVRAPPVWLGEGLAEYYSTFALSADGRKAQIGRPIGRHIVLLRDQFIPLAELLAVDRTSPLYNEAQRRGVFYAESWAWVHYLLAERPDGARELMTLADRLAAGASAEEGFRAVFGASLASVESQLLIYVRKLAFRYTEFTLRDAVRDEGAASAAPLSDAEGQAHLGDLLAHMGRLEEAETRLESARAADPGLALPYASLGVVRMRQSRTDEAVRLWRQAVALGATGFGSDLAHQWLERVRPARPAPKAPDSQGAGPLMPGQPAQPAPGTAEATVDRPPAAQPAILGLRALRSGELRAEGDLAQIDCRSDGIVFTLKTSDREIRVTAKAFADVEFVSFRTNEAGSIPCGPRKPGDRVYVTWVPLVPGEWASPAGSAGRAIAVEFLPIKQ